MVRIAHNATRGAHACMAAVAAGALAGALLVPAVPAQAAEGAAKDEVVYVKGSATGATEGIYVVNAFDTESALTLSDPARYESVENLSTDEALEQRDGAVSLTTTAGAPFYYQGTMDSESALPWDITVTYRLNGVEVQPADLAGADGILQITFDVQAKTDGSDVSDFAESYVLQAQGTFPSESFAVIDSGDATVARSGSDAVVTCLVLPGESKTFEISGLARDFCYDGWQVAGMALSMAVDLSSADAAQLADATAALESATDALAQGSDDLAEGGSALAEGAQLVSVGADALSIGADQAADGASTLSAGVDSAVAGLDELSSAGEVVAAGWSSVYAGIDELAAGLATLEQGSLAYQQGLAQSAADYKDAASQVKAAQGAYRQAAEAVMTAAEAYQQAAPEDMAAAKAQLEAAIDAMNAAEAQAVATSRAAGAYGALTQAQNTYSDLAAGISDTAVGAESLAAGSAELDDGLAQYLAGAQSAGEAAGALSDGADQLAQGVQGIAAGTEALALATSLVADGADELSSGSAQLADGAAQLAESVQGMDEQILDGLQDAVDEKLGAGFEPHSYVVPSNTEVDSVQFVYVIEGIDEPEQAAETSVDDEETPEQTLFDRFFALFQSEG